MSRLPPPADTALEPVRRGLLLTARADAATVARDADLQRDALLDEARRTADELVAAARRAGEDDATAVLATRMRQRRREARQAVLSVQRELYDELRRRCRAAAAALVDHPEYDVLRRRLANRARTQLGPAATVGEASAGGVLASARSERLDLSLPTLADRALNRSGAEMADLWTP
ncbi:hypothetical protein ACWGID_09120 [Kribbella sp. NPDC054772]